jgi:hypothetical protein
MKRTGNLLTPVILLIAIAMMPAIAAGASSYWSNQIIGPDYTVPASAFNPPDATEWNKFYGGYASQIASPYETPGGFLPYDFTDTAPINTTPAAPGSPYPRAVTVLPVIPDTVPGLFPIYSGTVPGVFPVYSDTVPMPVVPGNFAVVSPSLVFPSGSGSPVPVSFPNPAIIPFVYPVPVLPDTPDSGGASVTPAPTPAPEQAVFISDLNLQEDYVRITNSGLTPVDLTGWKIVEGNTRQTITFIAFPQGNGQTFTFTLYPLTTLTVYYGKSGPVTATEAYWPSAKNVWNDQGDTAYLYDPQGNLVSSLTR